MPQNHHAARSPTRLRNAKHHNKILLTSALFIFYTVSSLANRPIREFKRRLLVLSEAPIEQIWTLLSMWESAGTANKLIKKRATDEQVTIDTNLAKWKAVGLAYCIRTARENILGSAESLTLRMVANYYGCMWFASAMMVADPNNDVDLLRLERFTKFGHGLANLAADDQPFPDNEFLYIKESGFFSRFIKWLYPDTNIKSLCLPPPRVDSYNEVSTDNRKFLVSLSELLARIPELSDTYQYITDRFPLSFRLFHSSKNMGENVTDAFADRTRPPELPTRQRDYTWLGIGVPTDVPEQHLREHGPPLNELAIREYAGDPERISSTDLGLQ
jgi:hypothetical protein